MRVDPTVSIIISAYNRPQVIPFAIKSVLASDFEDWELIVVGDGCNAETEKAVRAFSDPRIHFHNLPENTGHQSAPHNKGIELARGEFVLFLNQDDMYFPEHISKRVAFMRATGAGISWSPILLLQHSGLEYGPVDIEKDRLTLDGAPPNGRFDPRCFIISSCWAVRREICHQVGPWLPVTETRLSPSQEWLYRANLRGLQIFYHPYVSVLCIHSGVRRYSYLGARSFEHERAWSWLSAGPLEKLNLLHCVAVQDSSELMRARLTLDDRSHPFRSFVERRLEKRGVHPHAFQRYLTGLKKGDWVGGHTHFTRSSPPAPQENTQIHASQAEADDFMGRGWHAAESEGRWTSATVAELFFTSPPERTDGENMTLELYGHTLNAEDVVVFKLDGSPSLTRKFGSTDELTAISIPGPGTHQLTITVSNPASPESLGLSEDKRLLGYRLRWFRITPTPAALERGASAQDNSSSKRGP